MDSISQAVLGASIGASILGKEIGYKGAILGAVIATIPDLDVIFYLFYDSYEMLSIHRGFSHSILFSLIAAFLLTYLLSKSKWTEKINAMKLWMFAWLALITHNLLDAFTTYGTQLLLPFSNRRIGFDSVNIVDPIYTIPLIIGLFLSLWYYRNRSSRRIFVNFGLIVSTSYLLLTLINKQHVNNSIAKELVKQGIEYNSLLTVPVGVANINWYGVAKSDDSIYMKKYSILNRNELEFEAFPINDNLLEGIDSEVVNKMKWFAKDFYTVEEVGDKLRIYNLQVDMRGIVKDDDRKSPTVGYFEISNTDGELEFSSGSIK